jgi:hypothetical protein
MKIIRNKYIPFPGYKAINLLGVLFVKNNAKIDEVTINHESIHSAQIAEVMIASIPFALLLWLFTNVWLGLLLVIASYYLWYVIEWLIRLPKGNAYKNISFEREAYANQDDLSYLKNRKRFDFAKYIKKTRV